ncbi:MAG: hypothetical protein L0177_11960 [Chloroflexi bacterium]|nr:hypothetical protein [Chloroflexota bacterium]
MSSATTVTLAPDSLEMEPGSQARVEIRLRNTTNLVDVFSIEVEGLDESLFELSTESVSLFPGDSATSVLTISVPRDKGFAAGTYPFKVRVGSRKDASQKVEALGKVEVKPFYSYEMEISPRRIVGKSGDYRVSITNQGNSELAIDLAATLKEGDVSFAFTPERPAVPPGGKMDATVSVTPNRRALRGASETHRFTLKAAPAQSGLEPFSFPAELEVPPRLPRWAVALAGVGAIALVGALVAVIFLVVSSLGETYDFEQSIVRIRERPDAQTPFAVGFALNPHPDPAVHKDVVADATWSSATSPSDAHLVIVLQSPDGRCADVTEENEGAPAVIDLVPDGADDPEWLAGCLQMARNSSALIANQWAVYLINATNGQMSGVKIKLRYE